MELDIKIPSREIYLIKLANSNLNGEKSYLQFGKYSFISLGQVHNYAGLITAIMIGYNNEIQDEFLNSFLFNIKTGLNSTPLNITNSKLTYQTNLKNIGYVCFKARFTLTSTQGLISLFDM